MPTRKSQPFWRSLRCDGMVGWKLWEGWHAGSVTQTPFARYECGHRPESNRRRVGLADIASAQPVQAVAPATTRVKMGEGSVPKFDIEADIEKALSAKKPPRSTKKTMIAALVVTLAVLDGLAVAGWLFFTGYDFRGPLPFSGTSAPGFRLL